MYHFAVSCSPLLFLCSTCCITLPFVYCSLQFFFVSSPFFSAFRYIKNFFPVIPFDQLFGLLVKPLFSYLVVALWFTMPIFSFADCCRHIAVHRSWLRSPTGVAGQNQLWRGHQGNARGVDSIHKVNGESETAPASQHQTR